jgi:hypothetical protein
MRMKKFTITLATAILSVILTVSLMAQGELDQSSILPVKPANSILYGNDVIIHFSGLESQRDACLSVAFNGWLYACYSVNTGTSWSWEIWRSMDDGLTWTLLRQQMLNTDWYVRAIDIVVTGLTQGDLLIFVSRILNNDVSGFSELLVSRLNGNTGTTITTLRDQVINSPDQFMDVAIASDYLFPAVGATPFSIGVAVSRFNSSADSLKFLTSSDGGNTLDNERLVTSTFSFLRNLSVAYGRSWNYNNGRYFVAWEARGGQTADLGEILTAHTVTFFNDVFTTPVRLDNMIGSTSEFARNPSICCQFNDTDNDMGNFTEVVLFDRAYDGNVNDFDVVGCYNKQASNTDNWSIFGIDATAATSDIQPDINFDPGYNNFLTTYCNLTNQKLRYLVKDMNMPDPYNWILIDDKYNDNNNLLAPYPKVEINPVYLQVAHVWNGEYVWGGQATFDAEYSYIGVEELSASDLSVTVSPNPAGSRVTFLVDIKEKGECTFSLYSLQGKELLCVTRNFSSPGEYTFNADVSAYQEGCYFFRITSGNQTGKGRLIVKR